MKKILVTGARGFIGRHLVHALVECGYQIRATTREYASAQPVPDRLEFCETEPLNDTADWSALLQGCSAVVHLAARAHVVKETDPDPPRAFLEQNCHATLRLAQQTRVNGIEQFVYLSSIGVLGRTSGKSKDAVFTTSSTPAPVEAYAESKLLAEKGLLELADDDFVPIIIRPTLVYGPKVKANFLTLLKLADKNLPLPFGTTGNLRNFCYVGNLVSAIETILKHPPDKPLTLNVADEEAISTSDLIKKITRMMGKKPRLIPFPAKIISFGLKILGKSRIAESVFGNLRVNTDELKETLNWTHPFTLEQGLQETVSWYCSGGEQND